MPKRDMELRGGVAADGGDGSGADRSEGPILNIRFVFDSFFI